MATTLAVYAGSFDPATRGHVDIIERASRLFDRLIVAIGTHPTRKGLFTFDERASMLAAITGHLGNVEVCAFEGLLVDFCRLRGATAIVRGLRNAADFEYELPFCHANGQMLPSASTVFLTTAPELSFVSASLVREIASHGGDVSRYAHAPVCDALRSKFGKPPAAG